MRKRAVDLSLAELAAMGANASLEAAQKAYKAGLTVTGIVDVRDGDRLVPLLAERRPSGTVSVVGAATVEREPEADDSISRRPDLGKFAG
ncbi:hypothetical protein [Bradyrhizobium sp. USDA 4353]